MAVYEHLPRRLTAYEFSGNTRANARVLPAATRVRRRCAECCVESWAPQVDAVMAAAAWAMAAAAGASTLDGKATTPMPSRGSLLCQMTSPVDGSSRNTSPAEPTKRFAPSKWTVDRLVDLSLVLQISVPVERSRATALPPTPM